MEYAHDQGQGRRPGSDRAAGHVDQSRPDHEILLAFIGILLFLGLWQLIGMEGWAGPTWPALPAVAAFLFDPARRPLFLRAATATFAMAGLGYAIGTAAGLSVAALAHLVTPLRPGLDRFASLLHAIPSIALAPLFIVLLSREFTGMAIAALGVFFVIYVAATSGLEASLAGQRDLFRVFGASHLTRLVGLDIPAAIPRLPVG